MHNELVMFGLSADLIWPLTKSDLKLRIWTFKMMIFSLWKLAYTSNKTTWAVEVFETHFKLGTNGAPATV